MHIHNSISDSLPEIESTCYDDAYLSLSDHDDFDPSLSQEHKPLFALCLVIATVSLLCILGCIVVAFALPKQYSLFAEANEDHPITSSIKISTEYFIGSIGNHEPFNYAIFNPCQFSARDLADLGLPLLLHKDSIRSQQDNVQNAFAETIDAQCNYSSTDNRWKFAISKISRDQLPTNFIWLENFPRTKMGPYAKTITQKTSINGHQTFIQYIRYYAQHGTSSASENACFFYIRPGIMMVLHDITGKTPTFQLCSRMHRIAEAIV